MFEETEDAIEEKKNKLMQDLFEWELWGRQKLLDECSLGHYHKTIWGYPHQSRKKTGKGIKKEKGEE